MPKPGPIIAVALFWEAVLEHFHGEGHVELELDVFQDMAERAGLLEVVPYQRQFHGVFEDVEPGDPIYAPTPTAMYLARRARSSKKYQPRSSKKL